MAVLNTLILVLLAKHLWRAFWIKRNKGDDSSKEGNGGGGDKGGANSIDSDI